MPQLLNLLQDHWISKRITTGISVLLLTFRHSIAYKLVFHEGIFVWIFISCPIHPLTPESQQCVSVPLIRGKTQENKSLWVWSRWNKRRTKRVHEPTLSAYFKGGSNWGVSRQILQTFLQPHFRPFKGFFSHKWFKCLKSWRQIL